MSVDCSLGKLASSSEGWSGAPILEQVEPLHLSASECKRVQASAAEVRDVVRPLYYGVEARWRLLFVSCGDGAV